MKLFRIRRLSLGLVCLAAAGAAGSARVQAATAPEANPGSPQTLEPLVVTGSLLPVAGAVPASPVMVIEAGTIGRSGASDPLRLLKQLTPYFSGNRNLGTELNNGGAGESFPGLRNLPTLVLINGRRMAPSPIRANSAGMAQADLNIIPTAMVERIEILKDGASTLYGSDAVGGVVNLILRRNYEGFEIGARYGATPDGEYQTRQAHLIGGVTTPKGSLTIGAQHFENTALPTTARPLAVMDPAQFAALGAAPGGIPATNSGIFAGRVGNFVLAGSPLAVGAAGHDPAVNSPGTKSSPLAAPQTIESLAAAGRYVPITDTDLARAVGSTNILNTTLYGFPLVVSTRRHQFMASGNRELIGRRLEVFGDFLFAQTTNGGNNLPPALIAAPGPAGANALTIPANNPYNLFGVTLGVGGAPGAPAVRTRLDELGSRASVNETNTFRVVAGLRGTLAGNYQWEVAYTHARGSAVQRFLGGANGANLNQLMIPRLDAGGGYVLDAAGRPLSVVNDAAGNPLPVYNYFALPGFNAPETLDRIRTTLYRDSVSVLRGGSVLLRGQPLALPAGPVAFAIGAEERREELESSVDGLFANGLALGYNPASTFAGGVRRSRAGFLEVSVPVTSARQARPGLRQIDLTAAVRQERIEPGGTATLPKFGLRWQPVDDGLTVRSTWARGFVAPSIFDLFGPAAGNSPSFTLLEGNGSSSPGGGTGRLITGGFGTAIELSNPLLASSRSESLTAGLVLAPRRLPGLTFTADYYEITQDEVGAIDYTSVYADLNARGAASVYAAGLVFADGSRLESNAPNQVTTTNVGSLRIARDPSGDRRVEGIDLAVDYVVPGERAGRFNLGASASVLLGHWFRPTPQDRHQQYARVFTDGANGLGGPAGLLPGYVLKPYVHHRLGPLASSLFLTYLPAVDAPGTLFGGRRATNTQRLDGRPYVIPDYFTVDLGVAYTLPNFKRAWLRDLTATAGANNLLNREAPYVPGGGNIENEGNTAKHVYDIVGRFLYVELKKAF